MESSNIQVAVRVRPKQQKEEFIADALDFDSSTIRVVHSDRFFESSYSRVFGPLTDQQEIYEFITPSLNQVEQGYSSTIMAYGQSGSGKTYTMFGPDDNPGLVFNSVSHIIRNLGESFTVSFTMIEIYLERIFDMLQDPDSSNKLAIRQDPLFGVYISGITEYVVQTPEDVFELIRRGNSNRSVRLTAYSECSSRSHCICQLNVESKAPNADGNITRAKVHLIDLAGNERLAKSGTISQGQFNEMVMINKSLVALGKIISLLANGKAKHIPYRDSRLTFMLKDSLEGRAGIAFIATISPTVYSVDETLNTLKFAKQARQVTLHEKPTEFSVADNKLVQRLQREIRYLKDIMKIPKNQDSIHLKLLSLQEENEKLKLNLELGMEKVLEENRLMKEKLRNLAKTQEFDELEQFCEKFPLIQVASTTTSSFRQTTPMTRTIDSRLVEVRIRKNPNTVEKRTASLHKTLEQFDREKNENSEQANKVKRLKTLQQIQAYRESKANEANEKFEKTLAMQEGLLKKIEGCKTQQFSEVTIKTFRDIDLAKKATAKAEAEKEKAMMDLKRIQSRKISRSPLRNAAAQQILSRNII